MAHTAAEIQNIQRQLDMLTGDGLANPASVQRDAAKNTTPRQRLSDVTPRRKSDGRHPLQRPSPISISSRGQNGQASSIGIHSASLPDALRICLPTLPPSCSLSNPSPTSVGHVPSSIMSRGTTFACDRELEEGELSIATSPSDGDVESQVEQHLSATDNDDDDDGGGGAEDSDNDGHGGSDESDSVHVDEAIRLAELALAQTAPDPTLVDDERGVQ
jgi:hypothetical protein